MVNVGQLRRSLTGDVDSDRSRNCRWGHLRGTCCSVQRGVNLSSRGMITDSQTTPTLTSHFVVLVVDQRKVLHD